MHPPVDNRSDPDYRAKLAEIARVAKAWQGPVVIVSHVDPDGDALGSCLGLKRALESLGKHVTIAMQPPRYLEFLVEPGELVESLPSLPADCLLFVLDVAARSRVAGAPVDGAAYLVNIDHHGTNDRFGDAAVVQPAKAATALLITELVDELGVEFTPRIATPCLAGILTDTGNFRYGNTNREVLETAGYLIDKGVAYVDLTDRLQWRHPTYFRTLGKVMDTVHFELDGELVIAHFTAAMRTGAGAADDDSDDFVGIIRYAEGVKIAVILKERAREHGLAREPMLAREQTGDVEVKVSVRTRGGVSAQAICVELGGGGHVAAAGATVAGDLATVEQKVVAACARELARAAAGTSPTEPHSGAY